MFDGFDVRDVATRATSIHVRIGGARPPLLLLHGYPQTHAMWHRVAPALAERYQIRGIPTMMLFARGSPSARTAGAMNAPGHRQVGAGARGARTGTAAAAGPARASG